jgi:hypothetical protein
MRIVWLLAGVLLVVPSLGSDATKEYDGRANAVDLEGSWQQVGVVWNGHVTMGEVACVWTYRNGKEKTHQDGRLLGERPYTVDASSRPAWMDGFRRNGGGTQGQNVEAHLPD